ncbi:MAG: DNA cytosine methyltransferase [Planctomycetes bacterium]|nr:DNA cytosine methyltransferase [Planctomycetota bacterium]
MLERATQRSNVWKFAEFFAGIGLVRFGLERADQRWMCAFANDLDEVKRQIYVGHYRCDPHAVDPSDVHVLPAANIPDVHLATASFPCTDLSVAGGRAGIRSGESSAFWGFHRVLDEMNPRRRPALVLLENVVGFLTSHHGKDFKDAMQAMNRIGYKVDPFIMDARWFVPQSRPRLFVVCQSEKITSDEMSIPIEESRIRPAKLASFINAHARSIRWGIRNLPDPVVELRTLRSIITGLPIGHPDWWSHERVEYLYNQMFPRHQAWIDKHRNASRYHYATAFRRVRPQPDGSKRSMAELRTDGIAGCLRTPKGGSGRQILMRAGRGRVDARLLSAQECAALMGADGFRINATLNQALFGFGDAVCVDVITWIAKNYLGPVLEVAESGQCEYAGKNGRPAIQA